jgi:protein-S-isoprenylcysteine O-methyltransferase Ste14
MLNQSIVNSENTPARSRKLNRASAIAAIVLSLIALLCVLSGYFQPPQPDEGSAAHIFQISIALLLPTLILFFFTADRKRPARSVRPLIIPAAALTIAFAALFYLEHYR